MVEGRGQAELATLLVSPIRPSPCRSVRQVDRGENIAAEKEGKSPIKIGPTLGRSSQIAKSVVARVGEIVVGISHAELHNSAARGNSLISGSETLRAQRAIKPGVI